MKFKPLYLFIVLLLTASCKKDKLEGEAEILRGNWKWVNTQKVTNTCEADTTWSYSYIDSTAASNEYSIEFLSKGKMLFRHNGGLVFRNRIVFKSIEPIVSSSYTHKIDIYVNNDENDIMHLLVGNDSLMVDDYPLDTDNSCENRHNHFLRE
jgi:hypothetical protein